MSNYIIDPSVFYWINVLSIIQTVLAVAGAAFLVAGIILIVFYCGTISELHEPEKPEENASRYAISDYERRYAISDYERNLKRYNDQRILANMYKKWMILCLICGCAFVVTSIFIPGKTTSVEMLVARTATFENVDWTVQQVKEVVDYIVSALKGV